MTTGVYVRGYYIVTDKRSTGGHTGINENVVKTFTLEVGDHTLHFAFSGIKMMQDMVRAVAKKYFLKNDINSTIGIGSIVLNAEDIYKFKDEIKPHAGPNFEGLMVHIKRTDEVDEDDIEEAFMISENCCEEVHSMCTIGSGGLLAEGILLSNPFTSPEKVIELVSTKDIHTGPTANIIPLS